MICDNCVVVWGKVESQLRLSLSIGGCNSNWFCNQGNDCNLKWWGVRQDELNVVHSFVSPWPRIWLKWFFASGLSNHNENFYALLEFLLKRTLFEKGKNALLIHHNHFVTITQYSLSISKPMAICFLVDWIRLYAFLPLCKILWFVNGVGYLVSMTFGKLLPHVSEKCSNVVMIRVPCVLCYFWGPYEPT